MNTKYAVHLTEAERARLRTLIGRGTAPARQLTRARLLLKANQGEGGSGWSDVAIAGALDVHRATVARVRRQYVTAGLQATLDRAPPDRVYPRKVDGAVEAQLIAVACGTPPAGQVRWTLRLLATELVRLELVDSLSYETVRRTLKQTGSSPG
jgi:transposase